RPARAVLRTPRGYSLTRSIRKEIRTSARHSSRFSPRSPIETTSSALMLRRVAWASASAALTASSELVVELPTSSMILVTAISSLGQPGRADQLWLREVVLRLCPAALRLVRAQRQPEREDRPHSLDDEDHDGESHRPARCLEQEDRLGHGNRSDREQE